MLHGLSKYTLHPAPLLCPACYHNTLQTPVVTKCGQQQTSDSMVWAYIVVSTSVTENLNFHLANLLMGTQTSCWVVSGPLASIGSHWHGPRSMMHHSQPLKCAATRGQMWRSPSRPKPRSSKARPLASRAWTPCSGESRDVHARAWRLGERAQLRAPH